MLLVSSVRGRWKQIPGRLHQIDGGYIRSLWGTTRRGSIYILRRNRRSWRRIGGNLIHVSPGQGGVWGCNRNNHIFYRRGKVQNYKIILLYSYIRKTIDNACAVFSPGFYQDRGMVAT